MRYVPEGYASVLTKAQWISGVAELPDMTPEKQDVGVIELAPGSCTFFVL